MRVSGGMVETYRPRSTKMTLDLDFAEETKSLVVLVFCDGPSKTLHAGKPLRSLQRTARRLSLAELLHLANASPTDDRLAEYFEPETDKLCADNCDTFAQSILFELSETFDSASPRTEQLEEARRVLNHAIHELDRVVDGLQ